MGSQRVEHDRMTFTPSLNLLQMLNDCRRSALSSWANSHVVVRRSASMIALNLSLSTDDWPLHFSLLVKKHKARRVVLGKNLVSSSLYTMYVRCEFQYQSFPSLLFFKHLLIWLHQVLAVAHRLFVAACRLLSSCSTRASDHMGSPVVSHTGLVAS